MAKGRAVRAWSKEDVKNLRRLRKRGFRPGVQRKSCVGREAQWRRRP